MLGVGYFNEVMNSLNHAAEGGSVLFDYGMMHLAEAESIKSELFNFGAVDAALYLSDFY